MIDGYLDLNNKNNHKKIDLVNNAATALVFLITVINVIVNGIN